MYRRVWVDRFCVDCGGWKTEGWNSDDMTSNLAGHLDFLDFNLDENLGTISSNGLKINTSEKNKWLTVKARANEALELTVSANNETIGTVEILGDGGLVTVKILFNRSNWSGVINSVSIMFKGKRGARVEVDYIKAERH
tara:strand:+ start:397 stop:813 length:417 start_codon:yes stop_codon:yes gene_type:complete